MSTPKSEEARAYFAALAELDNALRALTQACRVVAEKRYAYSMARNAYIRATEKAAEERAAGGAP